MAAATAQIVSMYFRRIRYLLTFSVISNFSCWACLLFCSFLLNKLSLLAQFDFNCGVSAFNCNRCQWYGAIQKAYISWRYLWLIDSFLIMSVQIIIIIFCFIYLKLTLTPYFHYYCTKWCICLIFIVNLEFPYLVIQTFKSSPLHAYYKNGEDSLKVTYRSQGQCHP